MEERAIVFTISQVSNTGWRIYTRDSRVKDADNNITVVKSKLINAMIMVSEILNDEGYTVLFEVD